MSLSCLAFVLLSRAPDVSVSITFASVIYGSFIVDALLSLCTCCSSFFFSWQVILCLFAFILSLTQIWTIFSPSTLTTLANFVISLD